MRNRYTCESEAINSKLQVTHMCCIAVNTLISTGISLTLPWVFINKMFLGKQSKLKNPTKLTKYLSFYKRVS